MKNPPSLPPNGFHFHMNEIQIQIQKEIPHSPTPTPLSVSLSLSLSNGHQSQQFHGYTHQDPIGQVGLCLINVSQAPPAVSVTAQLCPFRGLQQAASGGSGFRRESTDPRDRGPRWTVRRQELTVRSAARVPVQRPWSRDGDPPTPHSPDGPRPLRPRPPLPLSGPPFLSFAFHFRNWFSCFQEKYKKLLANLKYKKYFMLVFHCL